MPGLLAIVYGDAPSGRYQAARWRRMSALAFELPPAGGDRAAGRERDQVRLMVASRAGLRHARFLDLPDLLEPGDLLVVNTCATLPAALPARRSACISRRRSPRALAGRRPRALGGRAARRRRAATAAPAPASGSRCRAAAGRAARAVPRRPAAVGGPPPPPGAAARVPGPPRRADPLPPPAGPTPAGRLPDDLRDRARQRRDAERGPAVQRPRAGTARGPRHRRGARSCCTPASPRSSAASALPGALPRPGRTAAAVNAAKRVIAVGTTVVRALETGGRGRRAPVEGWTRPRGRRPSGACGSSTASSPAGTSPTRATC